MLRGVIITLLALMGTGTAAAQSESSGVSRIVHDSLDVEFPELDILPLVPPGGFSYGKNYDPLKMPSARSFEMPSRAFPYAPYEFVMPDRDLFLSLDRFRRQEGIAIPAAGVNGSRMIISNGGYMPLVLRGDHALGLAGSRQRFPSMGFSNSLSVGYVWEATDGITLYGNLNASDNMFHLNRFKDIGVSGRARVRVTDGVWLNGYGAYSLYNSAGAQQMPRGMYPTNSFGGTIEVKITDGFGVEGGAFREYDPFQRRWVTQPYFMPVFY